MDIFLQHTKKKINANIAICGSKSESNRLLILKQYIEGLELKNLSTADDTKVLQEILISTSSVADVHHAGTAMRFLTAYFALSQGSKVTLTGSERMQQRPIKILVEALRDLGAEIDYLKNDGYPPIRIKRTNKITKKKVAIQGNVSSQYISALLLVAPTLKNGLKIKLKGEITSLPYIKMTLKLLKKVGVKARFKDNVIRVKRLKKNKQITHTIESDWSSASYYFSAIALGDVGSKVTLSSYKKKSLQGDSVLPKIYAHFGVKTTFLDNKMLLEKTVNHNASTLTLDLKSAPDIAQTIAVTCFGNGIACDLYGLHTLKIKETDRLQALKNELEKFGAKVTITKDSLHLEASKSIESNASVVTFQDHRMAMAFAPLQLVTSLTICEAEVVSKSYPTFWEDFKVLLA